MCHDLAYVRAIFVFPKFAYIRETIIDANAVVFPCLIEPPTSMFLHKSCRVQPDTGYLGQIQRFHACEFHCKWFRLQPNAPHFHGL